MESVNFVKHKFMKYIIGNNKFLEISSEAIEIFEKCKQNNGKNEAGGILLGRCFKERIVVEQATSPNPNDKAGPAFFERNRGKAQKTVNENGTTVKAKEFILENGTHILSLIHGRQREIEI
jgi:hypothetical protein